MKMQFWIFSIVALLTLAGCSSYTVVSDYDRAMPFYDFKTYRWAEQPRPDSRDDFLVRNPLIDKRIKADVDREMAAKGFVRKDSGQVDFTIHAHAGVRERMYIDPPPPGLYYRGWRRGGYFSFWYAPYYLYPAVRYFEEGTLIIDIFDGATDNIAWRGVARGILKDYRSTEQLHRDIDEVVRKIMAQFPPVVK